MTKYYKSKETAIKHLKKHKSFFSTVFDFMREDRDVVIAALQHDPFCSIPHKFTDDKELALARKYSKETFFLNERFYELSPRLRQDRDVIMHTYKIHGFDSSRADEHCDFDDEEMVYAMLSSYPDELFRCSDNIRKDRTLIASIAKNFKKSQLHCMHETLKECPYFMDSLIAINPECIHYASEKLYANKDWMMKHYRSGNHRVAALLPASLFLDEALAKEIARKHALKIKDSLPETMVMSTWFLEAWLTQMIVVDIDNLPYELIEELGYEGSNWKDLPRKSTDLLQLIKISRLAETLEASLPNKENKQTAKI